ncbi:histone acetylation protein-domain-containing protein [Aspergillus pseudotamarii]|uniref:histone acetyltransferase n=1 Tax=Aspergillus pseudotamarii TaxID=132259 RepID=A0A5N6T055_ASPPS|nr:histone acetylation protein-domain-containing protein [Aspergillus pseudotamarii]KAE8139441.1 histone acetylation protein-domain-containing protein [Aspergillus pseudotamarii]
MILSQPFFVAASAALLSPGLAAGFSTELQSVLKNTHGGNEYGYPTDFTRGIMPIPVHSHNDYWRDIPFYTGLSKGCVSTEADVWLYNGTLYVGHDESSLTEERTFESLYVNPMLDVLKRQNPQTRFVTSPTKNGVFDTTTSQTLYFFVDVKTSGPETFEAVISALEPLRKEGYLTSLKDNKTVTSGPITVIGTGNTPLDMVGPVANRDYFFDAHLDALEENPEITSLISPIASTSFQETVGSVTYNSMSKVDVDLGDLLAKVLPTGVKVTIRHISSAPTPCTALFAPPPGEEPESTFCENHFLTVSVNADEHDGSEIIVFGIEVLVYSTAHLTTVFVSKADSTGFLHLLKNAPKVSLIRRISNGFLSFLVQTHQRPGVRLVVSLFARAQNQYLFPGSIENSGKHVLDDRGLIKWWCRAVDPILREYEPESGSHEKGLLDRAMESAQSSATAFLIVPGCDKFETRGFFPSTAKSDDKERPRWLNSYPLHQLCDNTDAPPRCLIPRFPDDPKTRFVVDLDDELPQQSEAGGSKEGAGQWRSVKSLEQFWEMMSFRQECSAGRLVGFLWLVINPPGLVNSVQMTSSRPVFKETAEDSSPATVPTSDQVDSNPIRTEMPDATSGGPVQDPSFQTGSLSSETHPKIQPNTDLNAFYWPEAGRGHAVMSEEDYKTAINFLLEQDFYNQEVSIASTKAWGEKVASIVDQLWVGQQVTGRNTSGESADKPAPTTNIINTGLVRKRKKDEQSQATTATTAQNEGRAGNDTVSGVVTVETSATETNESSGINVLQANLIRKKKKA